MTMYSMDYCIINETLFDGVEARIHVTKDKKKNEYDFNVEFIITKTRRDEY